VVFSVGGAKSVANIDTRGPKSLLFDIFTVLPLLFLTPKGGQTPLPTSMGGPWPDLPPLDPPLSIAPLQIHSYSEALPTTALILCWS